MLPSHSMYIYMVIWVQLQEYINSKEGIASRITYQTISELTFFMKVLHNNLLNNILQHEINEKPCWTSQILGEKSWKNVTCFCCEFCFRRRRRGADDQCIKTNKKMSHFFKNFLQGFVRFSKLFHWFHVAKCYSELKNEELSWKKLTPKLFRKLS